MKLVFNKMIKVCYRLNNLLIFFFLYNYICNERKKNKILKLYVDKDLKYIFICLNVKVL